MNAYAKRLLDVARACRESKRPDMFDMSKEIHGSCGTPACALGHYAARRDLQNFCEIVPEPSGYFMRIRGRPSGCFWEERPTLRYFGITREEGTELFFAQGCGEAKTPSQAADYIEKFVARKWPRAVERTDSELVADLMARITSGERIPEEA